MHDLWSINAKENKNLGAFLHFDKNVDPELKNKICAFLRWIRKEYVFPVRLNVYIIDEPYIITELNGEKVSATIFFPDNPKYHPYARISVGDYSNDVEKIGMFNAVCNILASIAHEITHYYQWLKDKNCIFNERQARYKANRIVYQYIEQSVQM